MTSNATIEKTTGEPVKAPAARARASGLRQTLRLLDGSNPMALPALLAVIGTALAPHAAFAQASDVGAMMKDTASSLHSMPSLLSAIAYISGILLGVSGLQQAKKHADAPQQVPIFSAIWRMVAAGLMVSLPTTAATVVATLFAGGIGSGLPISAVGGGSGGGSLGEVPLDQMLINMVNNLSSPLLTLLSGLCYVLGIIMMMQGILALSRQSSQDPRAGNATTIITKLAVAGALLAAPQAFSAVTGTLFGGSGGGSAAAVSLAYNPAGADAAAGDRMNGVLRAVFLWIQLVGIVAFIRGWFVLKAAMEGNGQNASKGAAFTHIIGGALAINITAFVKALGTTLGVNLIS